MRRWHGKLFLAAVVAAGAVVGAPASADPELDALIAELGLELGTIPARDMEHWQRPERIVVRADTPARIAWLEEAIDGVEFLPARSPEEALPHMGDADALVGFCEPELVAAAPKLRWVQLASAGAERCVAIPAVSDGGILVTNMQRVLSPQIGEHVIALMFALSRGLDLFLAQQQDGKWDPTALTAERPWELAGKTLLVVGLGGIGTQVAKRAKGLGMRVVATRNSERTGPDFVDYVGLADELDELAAEADVVVNATPLTPATAGLFDADFFAAMKPEALFINVGRGESVVTDDLLAALQAGTIAGAGLDVVDPEPLPADHPLWRAPNVIITPHVASASDVRWDRYWLIIRENIRRYVAGEPMYAVVDVERGY